jgi:hypothetical protein
MPAPTNGSIETALTASLLAAGFVKNTYVNGVVTPTPGVLPDQLAALVRALSSGDSQWFAQWQAIQAVVINPTAPAGSVSTGILP